MSKIYILSIVNDDKKLMKLFKDFERKYNGITGASDNYPHITFQIGKIKNLNEIKKELKKISSETKPIKIEIVGLTNWSKRRIYYKIKRTSDLIRLNKAINHLFKLYSKKFSTDYTTKLWIPHIAVGDKIQKNKFKNAFNEVNSKKIKRIHKINYIYIVEERQTGRFKTIKRYKLSK
jgi:hypothetical protein